MAVIGLLKKNADPSEEEIRKGLRLNFCRCGAYPRLIKAVKQAVYSEYPFAEVLSIDTSLAEAAPGVVLVITAKDVPGLNRFGAVRDQVVMVEKIARFRGDASNARGLYLRGEKGL